ERREAIHERARARWFLGRFGEACRLFRELTEARPDERSCAASVNRMNLAVAALDARETTGDVPAPCDVDTVKILEASVSTLESSCPEIAEVTSARLALVRARIHEGDAARAASTLAELDRSAYRLAPQQKVGAAILRGRAALLRRAFDEALTAFGTASQDARRL